MTEAESTKARHRLAELMLSTSLFAGLDARQVQLIIDLAREARTLLPGEFLFQEGEPARDMYIIDEGQLEVLKLEPVSGEIHHIANRLPGESVGELSLLDSGSRSASVRATVQSKLHVLPIQALESLAGEDRFVGAQTKINLAREITRRLRETTEKTASALQRQLEESRARLALGIFLLFALAGLAVYTICLRSVVEIQQHVPGEERTVSLILLLLMAVTAVIAMRRMGYPPRRFGLSTDNWRRDTIQSLRYSLSIVVAVTLAKLVIIKFFADEPIPLFALGRDSGLTFLDSRFLMTVLLYALTCPLQELVARGCVQSPLQQFLVGRPQRVQWTSIIVANLMFVTAHSHLTLAYAAATFLPGIFWGWLFARQGTLVGVSVSHVFIGVYVSFLLGTEGFL